MRGYFASHFFSDAVFQWTEDFVRIIEAQTQLDFYAPQRNANINDKRNKDNTITTLAISEADTQKLKEAHILIACLGGLSIDDGVVAEIMAHGVTIEFGADHGIHLPWLILGILADMRSQGSEDNRLYHSQMIIGKIREHGRVIYSYPGEKTYIQETVRAIQEFMEEH